MVKSKEKKSKVPSPDSDSHVSFSLQLSLLRPTENNKELFIDIRERKDSLGPLS